jgi:hypothetical protein
MIDGADLLCWATGTHSTDQLLARLDALVRVADGIGPAVWSRYGPQVT